MVSDVTTRVWIGSGSSDSVTFSGMLMLPPSRSAMMMSN